MATEVKPPKSTLRAEQSELTRRRVLDAAYALFVGQGYQNTSIRAVADEAQVAVRTIYLSVGSKAGLLEELVRRVKSDVDIGSLLAEAMSSDDPRDYLAGSARITRRFSERGGPVLDLIREASASEPDVAKAWEQFERDRYAGQRSVIAAITEKGRLKAGQTPQTATDTLWTLSSHEVYRLMTGSRGYSPARFEKWLTDVSCALVLD